MNRDEQIGLVCPFSHLRLSIGTFLMRKRTLNVKLLIGLCVGCAVLLGGTVLLHRFQVRRTAGKLLDLAVAQQEQGDPVEVATSLRRYLNLRPHDYPSYIRLADTIVALPEVPGIDFREVSKGYAVLESILLKVPRDQPEYDQLRRRVVDFTMSVRYYKVALEHLRYLLQRYPDDVALNMQYGQALLGSREFETAGDVFSQLIGFDERGTQKFQLDPKSVDFDQVVPPRVADARSERDIARQRWGKGVDQIDAYVHLAAILRHLDEERNRPAARLVVDQMVRMNADEFTAYLKRERYHVSESMIARDRDRDPMRADAEMALAKQDIAKARELAPDDAGVLRASAQLALEEEDYATAKKYLEQGIEKYPQDYRMYRTMAITANGQGETEQALAVVAQGLAVLPGNVNLLLLRSDLQLQARDLEGVRKTAEEMSQAGVRKELVAYLDARLELAGGNIGPAVKKLTAIRPLLTGFPGQVRRIDQMLANCYERQGQYDLAKAAYERVIESSRGSDATEPSLLQARSGLQRLQRRTQGQVAGANGTGTTGTGRGGSGSPATEIAFEDELAQALQDLAATKPDASEGEKKLVEAGLRAKRKQYDQAQAAYAQTRQLAAANTTDATVAAAVAAKAWSGSILVAISDPQEGLAPALEMLRKAQDEIRDKNVFGMTEENVALTYVGVVANDIERGPAEAARLVATAEKEFGDTTLNRIAKMGLISAQGGDQVKDLLNRLEVGMTDRSTVDRARFWSNIWLHYYKAGLRDDARRCLKSLAQLQPNNLRITTMLFDLAYESKDDQGMQEAVANLKKLADNTEWRCCEAARLLFLVLTGQKEKSALDEAVQLCDEAMRARPDWNKPYRVKGDIQMAKGDYAGAVTSYQKAFQLGPPQAAAVRKYSLALSRLGRPEEAQQALNNMLSEQQRGSILPEQQVANLLRIGKTAEALTLAKEVVDRSPDDPRRRVWYGQVLVKAKDTQAAEGEFRRAIELAPQLSQAWLALVATMVVNGNKAEAEAELRKAQLNLTQDELPTVMARGSEVLGRPGEAEEYYRMACDANPSSLAALRQIATFYLGKSYRRRDKPIKASRYLNEMLRLGASPDKAGDANVRWARQQMAQLLASTRRYKNTLKAVALLEENRVGGQLPREDQLKMAALLAAQPEPVLQQQAIARLAQLDNQNALSSNLRLLLARLYNRAGSWQKCEQTMTNLLAQHDSNPTLRAVYCEMLIARDNLSLAARQLRLLGSLVAGIDPSDKSKPAIERVLRELQARLLVKQGKRLEALAELKKNLPPSPEAKDVQQLQHVADLLVQLKFYPQAEQAYRKVVQLDPSKALLLARFLGRHGNLDQAFELFERAKTGSAGLMALRLSIDSISRRRDEVGDRYDARIEAWIDGLSRNHPQAYQVQIERARLRDGQGKHDEVAQIYRNLINQPALAAGGQRAAVLNNLAYMLALQGKGGKETLGMIDEAIKIIGPSAELLDTRGIVRLANGDVQGAIEDLQLSLLGGRSALKLLHLAMAQQAAGDQAAARKTLQEAQRSGLDKKQTHGLERQKYEQLLRELGVAEA
jgi:predicted Zn-dependent protease